MSFSTGMSTFLTSTAKDIANMDKKSIDALIHESEKKLNNHEISDKERYLLSYKLETLKNINQ